MSWVVVLVLERKPGLLDGEELVLMVSPETGTIVKLSGRPQKAEGWESSRISPSPQRMEEVLKIVVARLRNKLGINVRTFDVSVEFLETARRVQVPQP